MKTKLFSTLKISLLIFLLYAFTSLILVGGNNNFFKQIQDLTMKGSHGMLDPSLQNMAFIKEVETENETRNYLMVRNLLTGEEIEIDKKAQYPPLGWLDSANLLIYKSYKTFISYSESEFNQVLYKYNIYQKTISPIISVPLDSTFNNLFNAGNTLVFGTNDPDEQIIKVFKYNLENRTRTEFTALQKRNIELNNLVYNSKSKTLGFIETNDSIRGLKVLWDGHIDMIEKLQLTDQPKVVFDRMGERLFYTNCKTTKEGKDEFFIKAYNLSTKESQIIYKLSSNERCTYLDNYHNNNLVISLNVFNHNMDNLITMKDTGYVSPFTSKPVKILRVLPVNPLTIDQ